MIIRSEGENIYPIVRIKNEEVSLLTIGISKKALFSNLEDSTIGMKIILKQAPGTGSLLTHRLFQGDGPQIVLAL